MFPKENSLLTEIRRDHVPQVHRRILLRQRPKAFSMTSRVWSSAGGTHHRREHLRMCHHHQICRIYRRISLPPLRAYHRRHLASLTPPSKVWLHQPLCHRQRLPAPKWRRKSNRQTQPQAMRLLAAGDSGARSCPARLASRVKRDMNSSDARLRFAARKHKESSRCSI